MNTTARLHVVLAIALGTLTVGCVILFLGMATAVHADPPESWYVSPAGTANVSIVNSQIYSYSVGIQLNDGSGHVVQSNMVTGNSFGLVASGGLSSVAYNNRVATTTVALAPGPPATVTPGASPASIIANGISTSTITATISDQRSRPVADGTLVTFTTSLGQFPTASYTRTTATGMVTAVLTSSTMMGTATINISATTAFSNTTVQFIAGDPTTITVQVNPATQIVNSGATSTITATAFDIYGHSVPSATLSGYVLPSAMGSVSGLGMTGANGRTSGIWTPGTLIGNGTLYVTNGSVTGQAAITLTVGEPYTITLVPYPTFLIVGNSSSLTAIVYDRFGNRVVNGTVVSFTSSLGSTSPLTNITTDGSTSSSINSTQAGVAAITATSGLLARGYATVTFGPDAPATLALQAGPTSLGVGNSSVLTATVRDQYGNLVGSGIPVTFTTDLGNVVSLRYTTNGIATSSISSTVAGAAHITAASGLALGNATVTFRPDVPATLVLQASPTSQVVGNSSVLTATVRDRYGNLVGSGIPVTFTADLGNVASPGNTTNGIAISSISSTIRGTAHITATSGLSARDYATVTFGPDVPATVALQASPTSLGVGNSSVLTATVRDQYGNLVDSGIPVTFTTDLGNVVSPRNTTKGIAASSISSTVAGTAHIAATTTGAAPGSAVVTFAPDTPMTITVNVDPPNLTPNSGGTAMITATAVDRFNNPAPGRQLIGKLVPPALGSVSGLSLTDSYGRAFGTWTAGNIVVSGRLSVTYGTRTGTSDIALILSTPKAVSVQVVSPALFANSGMTTTLIATVSDAYGNDLPNVAVNFGLSLAPPTLGSVNASATTDSHGRATSTWTAAAGSLPGSGRVIADAGGGAIGSAPITLTADVPYSLTLRADPASPVAGIGSILMATVSDRFGNLVTDGTGVTFTSDCCADLPPGSTTHGVAVSQINWTGVGLVHITATSGLARGNVTVNFGPNAPSTAALQANPVTQVVGKSSVVTATIRDSYANLVRDGTRVTFATSLGNVSPPTGVTVNGIVTSSIVVTQSGLVTITAASGLPLGAITVTFRADAPTRTTVRLETDTLVVNTGTSASITVTLFDTYSNRVPGSPVTGTISPTTLGSLSWQSPTTDLNGRAFGRWWAGTVPGSGVLVVNGTTSPLTLLPRTVFLPVVMRDFPPTPTGTWVRINSGAANTYQIAVTLEVSATVQKDYIERMRFSNDRVNWGGWETFAPTATWNLDPPNGLKTVYAQFAGHWGGISAPISDTILLFMNGDFSQPDLASWYQDPNVLGVSSALETYTTSLTYGEIITLTSPAGLLGNPTLSCNNVLTNSYGKISQNFIMPSLIPGRQLVLRFNYHIYTQDLNMGLKDGYDRFEVLLNDTIVFSDMNQDKNQLPTCADYYNLGHREAIIPVTGDLGNNGNVAFRVYNRFDNNYNTYAYVDNVRLEFQGRSDNQSDEAPALPETPAEDTGR